VPGNRRISRDESERRLRLYYYPYRDRVTRDVLRIVRHEGRCVHIAIHSFAPAVRGVERRADVGLLYDPRRPREAAFAECLRACLAAHGLHVRMNWPYRGTNDGFPSAFRKRLSTARYIGLEIETNQQILETPAGTRRVGRILASCLVSCLPGSPEK
jgi:predicted N-formylglutamate amidohydrolase